MNLENILQQLNELEKKDPEDLEVDENWELEIDCRCGSCRELNGLSISTKSITDLDFLFTKIIRILITRLKEAEIIIKQTVVEPYISFETTVKSKALDYLEKWK